MRKVFNTHTHTLPVRFSALSRIKGEEFLEIFHWEHFRGNYLKLISGKTKSVNVFGVTEKCDSGDSLK